MMILFIELKICVLLNLVMLVNLVGKTILPIGTVIVVQYLLLQGVTRGIVVVKDNKRGEELQ